MFFNPHETITDAAIKTSPLTAGIGLEYMNFNLPDFIQYMMAVYAVFLAVDKVFVFYLRVKNRKNEPKE